VAGVRLAFPPLLALLLAAFAIAGCGEGQGRNAPGVTIGLTTSLPIVWQESADLSELLDPEGSRHWALGVLEKHGRVQPIDDLAAAQGELPLPGGALLVMAQPRPLAAVENVALDDWVRRGGHVLLFADPMLTAESRFSLGDKRRPQDAILLSPILARWGLELQFDHQQPLGERTVEALGEALPVNLHGRFVVLGNSRDCALSADGLIADCRIGKGRVVLLADAALLEDVAAEAVTGRASAFDALISRALDGD
jgi:hypothetical protein